MKAIITIGIALFLFGGSFQASAQATAYANIYATVVAPAGFSKTTDMTFNDITLTQKSGSVSINTSNNISSGLNVSQNGTATLAAFSISDSDHSTFDITLPTENITIGSGNFDNMIVSNFSSTQSVTRSINGTTREIKVGANLQIPENQMPGNYNTQNPFPVTLNYN